MKPETILKKLKTKPLITVEDDGELLNYLKYIDDVSDGLVGFINRLIKASKSIVKEITIKCWLNEYDQCPCCGYLEGDLEITLHSKDRKRSEVEEVVDEAIQDEYLEPGRQVYLRVK